jgi:flagellar L-ring protein FlgH
MKWLGLSLSLLGLVLVVPPVCAQSLWARRDPQTAYLFTDTRARCVGDLLTVVVNESTEMAATDKTDLSKQTSSSATANANLNAAAGGSMVRKFAGEVDALIGSQRSLDSQANTSIDRKLADRMAVVVVDVLPNGLLVVEGKRSRIINKEERTLVVTGIVRPLDIGPGNVIQSQFVADFTLTYEGHGPESSFLQHGWIGKVMNKLWPF